MATSDDFYRWGQKEPLSTPNLDKRFLDLALRLKPLESVVISWQAALAEVDAKVLTQTENVISGLRDQLASIVKLEWLTGTSSTSISLVEAAGRTLFLGDQDRALFAPGPFAVVQRVSDPTTYAIVQTAAYDGTTGQYDFTVVSTSGAAGPFSDWSVAAVAGSTLAQMNLLAQGQGARDTAVAAAGTTAADRQAVETAAAAVEADRQAVDTAAGQVETKRAEVAANAATVAQQVAEVDAAAINGRLDTLDQTVSGKVAPTGDIAAGDFAVWTDGKTIKSGGGFATTADATAGTNAVKPMTPARTKEAVLAFSLPPIVGINTQSATYTVVTGDKGKIIDLTGGGTFTVALPAVATAGAGFYFHVRKRDGKGVATLDPNAAELIDGLATIAVYQEDFSVYCDGTAWRTQGRQRGWVDIGTTAITVAAAALDFTAGFADTELRDMEFMVDGYQLSVSTSVFAQVYKSGSLASTNYYGAASFVNGPQSTGASTFGTASNFPIVNGFTINSGGSGRTATAGNLLLKLFKFADAGTGGGAHRIEGRAYLVNASDTVVISDGMQNTAGPITGVRFGASSGQFNAIGNVAQRGFRL